jgi:putative MATE family efflux protein
MAKELAYADDVVIDIAQPKPEAATTKADHEALTRAAILAGPILPILMRLALPTVAVLVAQTAVSVAEAYYVGFLGTAALAGVALVFPIFMLMAMMSNGGLGSGIASSIARAVGAGRQHDADALVFHALVLAIVVGALFTLGALCGGPALYYALGGRDAALEAALKYSNILFAGSIAVWIVNFFAAALRGVGNVKVPAIVTLVGALVMIPASPALIFGVGSLPGFGIAGAGIAFSIYYGGALLVLLRYMASGRSGLTLRITRLEGRLFMDILKVGVPTAVSAVFSNLNVILVTGAIGLFGTGALAAYGIASRLDYAMIPVLFGLSSAVLTMVGINMGAGQTARAKRIAWVSSLVGAGASEIIGLVVAFKPSLWLNLFSRAPDVVGPAEIYLHVVAPAYGALGLAFVISFAAQGTGHMLWPLAGITVRMIVAAGLGWIVVAYFDAGMTILAFIIAGSIIASALISSIAMFSSAVWRPAKV